MEYKFKFEKLIIWREAMALGDEIVNLSRKFPKAGLYNLSLQINRAVDSIALNISEGSISQSNPELNRFIGYAIRSPAEVVTSLHKAKNRDYISIDEFDIFYEKSFIQMNKLIAFKNKIK